MEQSQNHFPVFGREVKKIILECSPGIFVDLTFGRGGYSRIMLENPENKILAIDQDPEAVEFGLSQIHSKNFKIHQCNYSEFITIYNKEFPHSNPKLIIADLGISSPQIDNPHRGMSFRHPDELLDLRMDQTQGEPAWQWLQTVDPEELGTILADYGELHKVRSIASKIIFRAREKPLTCGMLASLCNSFPQPKYNHIATLVYQAIRIHLNQELQHLDNLLFVLQKQNWENCTMAFVTFHSLEDRVVKRRAKEFGWKEKYFFKKVSSEELDENSRSSSAKLRVYEK